MRRNGTELRQALASNPEALATWDALLLEDQRALESFVNDAWARRGRSRRASLVASKCSAGVSAVWEWQTNGYAAALAGWQSQFPWSGPA